MAGKAMQHSATGYGREDFHYELPERLIAQQPAARRDGSRLLVVDRDGSLRHLQFPDVVTLFEPGDLLVVNDTRVLKARLQATKDTGGRAEILLERRTGEREALCQIRASKPPQAGRTLIIAQTWARVLGRAGQFYRLQFELPVLEVLEAHGSVPLPPYITRAAQQVDAERYQTIWSQAPGAVAAPTAGLHFTPALLEAIRAAGVDRTAITLHVGAGTFQPVRVSDLATHRMHGEHYEIEPGCVAAIRATRERGGRVIAVGTTVVRALESAAAEDGLPRAGGGETELFITPGYDFKVVDALLTNFHLPQSTLLMLVTAFAGYEPVMAAYREAVAAQYRFFSYGDAMFLQRNGAHAADDAAAKEAQSS